MNKITITQTIKIKIGEQEHELTKEDAEALRDSLVEMLGTKPESKSGGLSEYMEELQRRTREYQDRPPIVIPPSYIPRSPFSPGHPDFDPHRITCATDKAPNYHIPKTQIPTDAEVTAAMESR